MSAVDSKTLTVALSLALAAVPGAAPAHAQDVGLPIGSVPAAVTIQQLSGTPIELRRLTAGRPAVIEFWATWCPVCEELAPEFEAAYRRFGDRAAFVTIAVAVGQSPRRVRRHLERHPMPGYLLWDDGGRATRAFRAPTTSYVVILDSAGRVRYTGTGGDQPLSEALARVIAEESRPGG